MRASSRNHSKYRMIQTSSSLDRQGQPGAYSHRQSNTIQRQTYRGNSFPQFQENTFIGDSKYLRQRNQFIGEGKNNTNNNSENGSSLWKGERKQKTECNNNNSSIQESQWRNKFEQSRHNQDRNNEKNNIREGFKHWQQGQKSNNQQQGYGECQNKGENKKYQDSLVSYSQSNYKGVQLQKGFIALDTGTLSGSTNNEADKRNFSSIPENRIRKNAIKDLTQQQMIEQVQEICQVVLMDKLIHQDLSRQQFNLVPSYLNREEILLEHLETKLSRF